MSMKPIASKEYGWCYIPILLTYNAGSIVEVIDALGDYKSFLLPYDITFAQFLDQYNKCTDNIYFID